MKKANLIITFIIIFMGCSKSEIFDNEDRDICAYMKPDSIQLFNSYCSGFGNNCLPNVDIYHSDDGTVITWSGNEYLDCNSFFLTCSGDDLYRSGSIGANGTWYFNHDKTAYTFTYTLRCDSKCNSCKDTKKFIKKLNNDGILGASTDCQKEYLSYSVEPGDYNSGFKLCTRSSWDEQQNTEDYLVVDSYKIFKSGYGSSHQLIKSGTIIPDVTTVSLPYNMANEYCQVRFYSSSCTHSEEHYLYNTYYDDGQASSLTFHNLNVSKAHY